MSKLSDLQTDRNKIIELTGVIERMEKDKSRIEDWVKAKEKEVNDFEARALKTRTDLESLKKKTDSAIKESDKKKLELVGLQMKLTKDLQDLQALKAENEKMEHDNSARFQVLEQKQERFEKLESEVNGKLKKWNEIQEAFHLIK